MRKALGFALVAAFALGMPSPAFAEPVNQSRQKKFEVGCKRGCLRESGDSTYCQKYCACTRAALFRGRSEAEVQALYAAMHPKAPESPARATVHAMSGKCVASADAP